MPSIIWCGRAPIITPLSVGEATTLIDEAITNRFVYIDTEDGNQVALAIHHITSVTPAQT